MTNTHAGEGERARALLKINERRLRQSAHKLFSTLSLVFVLAVAIYGDRCTSFGQPKSRPRTQR